MGRLEHDLQQSHADLFARFVDRDGSAPGQGINRPAVLPDVEKLFDVVGKASHAYRSPVSWGWSDSGRIGHAVALVTAWNSAGFERTRPDADPIKRFSRTSPTLNR